MIWLRYALFTHFVAMLCEGWEIDADGMLDPSCPDHHGNWSLMLKWAGEAEP